MALILERFFEIRGGEEDADERAQAEMERLAAERGLLLEKELRNPECIDWWHAWGPGGRDGYKTIRGAKRGLEAFSKAEGMGDIIGYVSELRFKERNRNYTFHSVNVKHKA